MTIDRNDHSPDGIEIHDLETAAEDARNAEQVKGGFDPQPDPPSIGVPVMRPPVLPSPYLPYIERTL